MEVINYIDYNGEYLPSDSPVLNIENRGFRYGDALFETIRVVNGNICSLQGHYNRLMKGMEILKMNVPEVFSEQFLCKQITTLINKNKLNKGGRVRLTVFRNFGGLFTPEVNDVSYIIEAREIKENLFEINEQGYSIDLYEDQRKPITSVSVIKSSNSLFYILAGIYKKEKGLDECIIMNELGSISEAISHNIFVVFNGVLYTPSLNQGCIPGVMRQNIIEIAHEQKMEVQECPLNPAVMLKADEVFLTNSINGIRWVLSYRTKRYFRKMSDFLVEKLNEKAVSSKMGLPENSQ